MNLLITNLQKKYQEKLILDIKSLFIKKERITGLTGPNGIGKTTLLNIIAGLDKSYSGDIHYDGQKPSTSTYKEMTLVFQKPYLLKRSVFENIAYPLKLRKMDKETIHKRVDDMMVKLEIDDLKWQKGTSLSGGESQKVALARALVFEPKLLLLDEPTSNIDPLSRKVIEREIINYNLKSKGTILLVTHDLEQAKRVCTDMIDLSKTEEVI